MRRTHASVLAAAVLAALGQARPAHAQDPFIGEIRWVAFDFAPRGWALCDGQILAIVQHTALFSLLGTTYGGDGQTTFGLPDVRGRGLIHAGQGPGLSNRDLGEIGGTESVALTAAEMPPHTHALNGSSEAAVAQKSTPAGKVLAKARKVYGTGAADAAMRADAVGLAGFGDAHENMAPFTTLHCVIALEGIFPSPN